jgi:hypothetical protein
MNKKKPNAGRPKEPPIGVLARLNTAREKSIVTEIANTAPAIIAGAFTFAFSTWATTILSVY